MNTKTTVFVVLGVLSVLLLASGMAGAIKNDGVVATSICSIIGFFAASILAHEEKKSTKTVTNCAIGAELLLTALNAYLTISAMGNGGSLGNYSSRQVPVVLLIQMIILIGVVIYGRSRK